jgi:uncharacterized protein
VNSAQWTSHPSTCAFTSFILIDLSSHAQPSSVRPPATLLLNSTPLLEEKWDLGSHALTPNICGPHQRQYVERYNNAMKQDDVLRILKQKNTELAKQFGVKSLQLFGSVARNEATPASDVDLLVEFDRPVGYFGLFALQDYLEKLLGCSVDLGTPNSLKPYIRERIMGEIVHVT